MPRVGGLVLGVSCWGPCVGGLVLGAACWGLVVGMLVEKSETRTKSPRKILLFVQISYFEL